MQGVKPWQLAVIVIGLLVGGGLIAWQGLTSNEVKLAESVVVVDVLTGELFEVPLPEGQAISFPLKNPNSGKAALIPAAQVDGKWFVRTRFREFVPELLKTLGEKKGAINAETSEVVSPAGPIEADLAGNG
jgi:hypothetical protein